VLYQKRLLPAIALVLGCLGSGALGTDQKDNETVQFKGVKKRSTLIYQAEIFGSQVCIYSCNLVNLFQKIAQPQFSTSRVRNSFCPICSNYK
jgi:hypothetical protein